jgi:tetratricopeptide (TPR) repeat protein
LIGLLQGEAGRLDEARDTLDTALLLRRANHSASAAEDACSALVHCLHILGGNAEARWDLAAAARSYSEALELVAGASRPMMVDAQSVLQCSLGDLAWWQADYPRCVSFYSAVRTGLVDAEPGSEAGYRWWHATWSLCHVHELTGDWNQASGLAAEASLFARKCVDASGAPRALRCLGAALAKEGDVTLGRGDPARALLLHEEACVARAQLALESPAPAHLRDHSSSLDRLGALAEAAGRLDEALRFQFEAYELVERIHGLSPDLNASNDLVSQAVVLARLLVRLGRSDDARARLNGVVGVVEMLRKVDDPYIKDSVCQYDGVVR